MSIPSLLWLFPVVFMLHDFEEILMMRSWLDHNSADLRQRFPRIPTRLLGTVSSLSTAAFSLAVAEEFLLISLLTLLCVELRLYDLWAGMLLAFFLHLIMHAGQYLAFRRYIPAIVTVLPASIYCLYAVARLSGGHLLSISHTALWSVAALIAMVANLAFAHALAARFDRWLARA